MTPEFIQRIDVDRVTAHSQKQSTRTTRQKNYKQKGQGEDEVQKKSPIIP